MTAVFPGDVQCRFLLVPHGFVEVVGVLAAPAVDGHQPHGVGAVVSPHRTEVEHVLDPDAPQQRVVLQAAGVFFVEKGLAFFGHPVRRGLVVQRHRRVAYDARGAVLDGRAEVRPAFA